MKVKYEIKLPDGRVATRTGNGGYQYVIAVFGGRNEATQRKGHAETVAYFKAEVPKTKARMAPEGRAKEVAKWKELYAWHGETAHADAVKTEHELYECAERELARMEAYLADPAAMLAKALEEGKTARTNEVCYSTRRDLAEKKANEMRHYWNDVRVLEIKPEEMREVKPRAKKVKETA